MVLELDENKRRFTLDVRGLDTARAGEVFAGATLTVADDRKNYGEDRFITIGFLDGSSGDPGPDSSRRRASYHQQEESQ